ncbi:alkaline phosphatase [Exophiala viscosa]|uniref:Alkaline phosphatase n=1 Tax=Exophiala viscosa TaxID=2486360 RepID=A0AAN6IFI5_9EURO|nr:alkaline phosphatase [Exophiala viscosa]KAI1621806.1 alkaline phosphatase [Exophiala viscosa]
MASTEEIIAASTSTVARLSAYIFLRWIPGHHFPPLILTTVVIYLSFVFGRSKAFGPSRRSLHDLFPKLFHHPDNHESEEHDGKEAQHDHEEPVLYKEEKSFLKIFLLGIPDWLEPDWSYLTIGINILLALFTLDLVFRGLLLHPARDLSFTRVGYVDSTSAKVLFREPDSSQLPMYVYLSVAQTNSWTITDTIYYLGEDTDYTHVITFENLLPSKKYSYLLSNNKSGEFITAASPDSEASNSLTFLTSSCIKANFPYKPSAQALAIHGFDYLSKVVSGLPSRAAFMLFLGDFIYVDVPLRLSSSLQHYRAEYRRVYASPSWSLPGLDTLPWIHTLDDHEIANDWSSGNDTDPFPAASDPFIHYHVSVNPPIPAGAPTGPEANTTFFQFSNGPASFFMLDTRRYRTDPESASSSSSTSKPLYGSSSQPSNPPHPHTNRTMLGAVQLASLLKYLATPEPAHVHWKIIASSVPFTKNWRFGTSDTWGGFLQERSRILAAMHAAERDLGVRIIVLSGDRHEFAAIRYPAPTSEHSVDGAKSLNQIKNRPSPKQPEQQKSYDPTPQAGPHEFSVGPLSMFYLPFRTFKQIDDEDVAINYLPDGNSKVGAVHIQNLVGDTQRSLLTYSLYIDGNLAWEYALTSPAIGADMAKADRRRRRTSGWLWD